MQPHKDDSVIVGVGGNIVPLYDNLLERITNLAICLYLAAERHLPGQKIRTDYSDGVCASILYGVEAILYADFNPIILCYLYLKIFR